jgi:hypothetical protein
LFSAEERLIWSLLDIKLEELQGDMFVQNKNVGQLTLKDIHHAAAEHPPEDPAICHCVCLGGGHPYTIGFLLLHQVPLNVCQSTLKLCDIKYFLLVSLVLLGQLSSSKYL